MKKWLIIGGTTLIVLAVVLPLTLTGRGTTETGGFLTVASPQDESIVNTFETTVAGVTVPDAVVSVNGVLVEVDADGNFSTAVALDEGPNSIEVIASDYEGNEASKILTVIYLA